MPAVASTAPQPREKLTFRFWFAAIVVMATFFLSGQALIALGQNYMLGSEPEKIHPATYFATIFLIVQFFTYGQRRFLQLLQDNIGAVLIIVAVVILTFYVAIFLSVPAAGLPDTWLLPAMMLLLCAQLGDREAKVLRIMLDVFMLMNSVIGMGEVVLDKRIIPLSIASAALGQYIYPIEWRASAFLGHPLTAAYTTGCYILLLVLDGRVRPLFLRVGLIGVHCCSLLAFGSRGAMGFLAITLACCMVAALLQSAVTRKIRKDVLIYVSLTLPVAILGVPAVLGSGLADRFINRFSQDGGSASARFGMWDMFQAFSWSDLIFGPPKVFMDALGARFKIGSGIESFWFGFLFTFGIVGCVIFMPALYVFCRDLIRRTGPKLVPVLIFFFACCSTSVSLSSRSLDLAYVVGLMMTSRVRRPTLVQRPARRMPLRSTDEAFGLPPLSAAGGEPRRVGAYAATPLLR